MNMSLFALIWASVAGFACSFSSPQVIAARAYAAAATMPPSALQATVVMDHHDESSYRQMLTKAREYAFSDELTPTSAQQAQEFLDDIFHMEILCVSGVVAGDVCENVDEVAMVVARLREKAHQASLLAAAQDHDGSLVAPQDQNQSLLAILRPLVLVVACATLIPPFLLVSASMVNWGRGDVPLTMNEWMWAAKDGYLWSMVTHFIRNGGL
eukprot:CAMPEP_0172463210 /NCGR_PEP_ID=MMETSP1065-20121228/46333_1 /TAXON_ID=265537 /ORGANISM="Amphiprora paludosa, Strain CCMP125" /LENGTH=211 /DNA_ID=CAMNT_0013219105 /DNA_START=197 /DNA_END=832 /DNA_ORIENTATION=-